jgi:hypothetical protein
MARPPRPIAETTAETTFDSRQRPPRMIIPASFRLTDHQKFRRK